MQRAPEKRGRKLKIDIQMVNEFPALCWIKFVLNVDMYLRGGVINMYQSTVNRLIGVQTVNKQINSILRQLIIITRGIYNGDRLK